MVVIGNLLMSVVLNGILGAVYTMVNSLQMIIAYSLLIVEMPANVILVMNQINAIASFDILPSDKIFAYCFDFSTTVLPFVSF